MDKYFTHYSHKDCVSILKGKNIYDVFNYTIDFSKDEITATIIFTKCNTRLSGSFRTCYIMRFVCPDNGTYIDMEFQHESFSKLAPFIPDHWLDEFMEVKLSAKRVWKY